MSYVSETEAEETEAEEYVSNEPLRISYAPPHAPLRSYYRAFSIKKAEKGSPIPIIRAKNGDTSYFKRTPVEYWAKVTDGAGRSVLIKSVRNNHLHCTKAIYERCPDLLQEVWRFNFSPLHVAALRETKPSLIKFLISVADRKIYRMRDVHYSTPLEVAILKSRIKAVELLSEADPDQLSSGTPLLYALRLSHGRRDDHISVKIRRLLLEKQPNACKTRMGKLEWTMLHYAAFEGDLGAIDDIIRFCPDSVHMVDKYGKDFLEIALVFGHSEMVEKILQKKDLHLVFRMSEREKELCIPPQYLLLYRELVKRFGEIVEPSKCLEEDTTPMYAALGHFLGHVYKVAHVETENVTQEKISEWEKMAAEYSALGLQLSWFQELVTGFAKRAEHASHFRDAIVTKEAEIATKKKAWKILKNELNELENKMNELENKMNELETEVAKLKQQQRDTFTPQSDDPWLVIRRIEGIIPANSATEERQKYRDNISDFRILLEFYNK